MKLDLGEPCAKRTYKTQLTEEECLMALSMKNYAQKMAYRFDASAHMIEFNGWVINGIIEMVNTSYCYAFSVAEIENGSFLSIVFCETPMSPLPLTVSVLDDFFSFKLDAVPWEWE